MSTGSSNTTNQAAAAAPSAATPAATPIAPAPANLLQRLFTGAKDDVSAVGGAITSGVHALESGSLFAELAPKLKADFEQALPSALAAGEQSVADLITAKVPAAWDEILTGAGPIITAFVQGVLARIPAAAATSTPTPTSSAPATTPAAK